MSYAEAVNQRSTENTIATKRTNGITMIYKTLHRKLNATITPQ
jgi:hypothetical protein